MLQQQKQQAVKKIEAQSAKKSSSRKVKISKIKFVPATILCKTVETQY